jgi:hypothetical protein
MSTTPDTGTVCGIAISAILGSSILGSSAIAVMGFSLDWGKYAQPKKKRRRKGRAGLC